MSPHKPIPTRNAKIAFLITLLITLITNNTFGQARQAYDDAAKAFLEAASKTKCPERKAFFIRGANFNKCMANALGGKGTGNCGISPDLNNVPPCPADPNGGGQSATSSAAPIRVNENDQTVEAINQLGTAVVSIMTAIDNRKAAASDRLQLEEEQKKTAAKIQFIKDLHSQAQEDMDEKSREIPGEYKTCETCNGAGLLACTFCNSIGFPVCKLCFGSGSASYGGTCSGCQGRGKHACGMCEGIGQTECYACKTLGIRYVNDQQWIDEQAELGNIVAQYWASFANPKWKALLIEKKYPQIFMFEASAHFENKLKYYDLLRQGCTAGDRAAMGAISGLTSYILFEKPENYSLFNEFATWGEKGAALKDAQAIYQLTVLKAKFEYDLGYETEAYKSGNDYTEFFIGLCYYYGVAVQKDFAEAEKWLSKVGKKSKSGPPIYYPYAQLHLGLIYGSGGGSIKQNKEKAKKFYTEALQLGVKEASKLMSSL